MYPNHVTLERTTKRRMEEDRIAAESTQYLHPNQARLNLLTWQERVRKVLEGLEAVRMDLDQKESSVSDSA